MTSEKLKGRARFLEDPLKVVDPPSTCGVAEGTAEIGSFQPNVLGLYDMQGNVHEWCRDHVRGAIVKVGLNSFGCDRMLKGGAWDSVAQVCDPSLVYTKTSSMSGATCGFRLSCQ